MADQYGEYAESQIPVETLHAGFKVGYVRDSLLHDLPAFLCGTFIKYQMVLLLFICFGLITHEISSGTSLFTSTRTSPRTGSFRCRRVVIYRAVLVNRVLHGCEMRRFISIPHIKYMLGNFPSKASPTSTSESWIVVSDKSFYMYCRLYISAVR